MAVSYHSKELKDINIAKHVEVISLLSLLEEVAQGTSYVYYFGPELSLLGSTRIYSMARVLEFEVRNPLTVNHSHHPLTVRHSHDAVSHHQRHVSLNQPSISNKVFGSRSHLA